jgi:DNA-binding GntR family transcriptional regulator
MPTRGHLERVYEELKRRIVLCELAPGSVVLEDALAAEFGTSRTPIREALLHLRRDSLVVIYPRRGTFVSQIAPRDVHEVFQIRQIVEPRVARLGCRAMGAAELARYREGFLRSDAGEDSFVAWCELDRDFHSALIASVDNRTLSELYATIMDRTQRLRILSGRLPMRMPVSNREHVEIIDALLARDEERVERLLSDHLAGARDACLRLTPAEDSR